MPQAKAHPNDALALKRRKAVFARYGRQGIHNRQSVRLLRKGFLEGQVDACVAKGGRVI